VTSKTDESLDEIHLSSGRVERKLLANAAFVFVVIFFNFDHIQDIENKVE
jgi:hypothetical protein